MDWSIIIGIICGIGSGAATYVVFYNKISTKLAEIEITIKNNSIDKIEERIRHIETRQSVQETKIEQQMQLFEKIDTKIDKLYDLLNKK